MKIIKVSNFDNKSISDVLIAEKVVDYYADIMVNTLNERCSGDYAPDFFRLVGDDYKLYTFEP